MIRTLIQIGLPILIGNLICIPFSSDEDIRLSVGVFLAMLTDIAIRYYEAENNMDHHGWKWLFNKYYGMVLLIIPIPAWIWLMIGFMECIEKVLR